MFLFSNGNYIRLNSPLSVQTSMLGALLVLIHKTAKWVVICACQAQAGESVVSDRGRFKGQVANVGNSGECVNFH